MYTIGPRYGLAIAETIRVALERHAIEHAFVEYEPEYLRARWAQRAAIAHEHLARAVRRHAEGCGYVVLGVVVHV